MPVAPRVVACEVAAEQIASVVTAVGCAHDGVHVERLGLIVVQEDTLMAVVLDHENGTVDPVVERVVVAGSADPSYVGVVQMAFDILEQGAGGGHLRLSDLLPIREALTRAASDLAARVRSDTMGAHLPSRP
jgi:hypothetical protein